MKKFLVGAMAAGLLVGGAGFAHASDPHQPQDGGLCTAFFNGQKVGWEKNGTPPPFQDLSNRAGDGSDSGSTAGEAADVYDYCNGLIGGQPSHGRYTCGKTTADDPTTLTVDESQQTSCSSNEKPGNGPKA